MRVDIKQLPQARATKAKDGKTALEQLNALQGKATLTEAETTQVGELETKVDALEAEVAELDKQSRPRNRSCAGRRCSAPRSPSAARHWRPSSTTSVRSGPAVSAASRNSLFRSAMR